MLHIMYASVLFFVCLHVRVVVSKEIEPSAPAVCVRACAFDSILKSHSFELLNAWHAHRMLTQAKLQLSVNLVVGVGERRKTTIMTYFFDLRGKDPSCLHLC
jgi:hypothetical protein